MDTKRAGRAKRQKAAQGRGGFTQANAREGRGMTAREKKRGVTNLLVPFMVEGGGELITMIWPAERLFEGFLVCKKVKGLLRAAGPWHFLTLHVREKTGRGGAGGSGGAARSGPSEWTLHKLLPILGRVEIVLDSHAQIPCVLEQINKAERDSSEECPKHKAAGYGNKCTCWGCFRTLTLTPEAYVGALPDPMDPHAPSPAHTTPDVAAGQGGSGENADSGPRAVGRSRFELVIRVGDRSSDTKPPDVLNEMMRRHLLRELNGLTLFRSNLEDKGALVVAEVLEACKNLERLNLSHNRIGEKGVCDLAQALAGGACPALTCLDLRNNNFGPRGMRELAEALAKCKKLTTCKLSQNAIKLAGAKAVAKMLPECKQLERLYISFTEMGDEGTRQVANALAQTERLSVLKMYGLPAESKSTQDLVRGKTEAKKVILFV